MGFWLWGSPVHDNASFTIPITGPLVSVHATRINRRLSLLSTIVTTNVISSGRNGTTMMRLSSSMTVSLPVVLLWFTLFLHTPNNICSAAKISHVRTELYEQQPRRLAANKDGKTSSPTEIPSAAPTAIDDRTLPPTINIIPSNVPTVTPDATPVLPPSSPTNGNGNSTNSPPTGKPINNNINTPTAKPITNNSTADAAFLRNLSDFDVLVTAIVTAPSDANDSSGGGGGGGGVSVEEQLLIYRKELRIALEDYLWTALNLTATSEVELYAIPSLQTQRTRNVQSNTAADTNNNTTGSSGAKLTVNQWYSYGGVVRFPSGTRNVAQSYIDEQQATALSDPALVQASLGPDLASVITIQDISIRNTSTMDDDDNPNNSGNNTDTTDPDNGGNETVDRNSNDSSTTIIASVIAGSVGLLCAAGLVLRRRRRRRPKAATNGDPDAVNPKPPVPNITMLMSPTTTNTSSCRVPFSPYGDEPSDGEENDDHHTSSNHRKNSAHVQSIVNDLEETWSHLQRQQNQHEPPPPMQMHLSKESTEEPYLQLDVTSSQGQTHENSRGEELEAPMTMGVITASAPLDAPPPEPFQFVENSADEDAMLRPNVDTTKMIEPSSIYRHRTINSYKVKESTKTAGPGHPTNKSKDDNRNGGEQMYSVPVVSMANSHDSVDGYSLTSGFYGGQRPSHLRTTTTTASTKTSPDTTRAALFRRSEVAPPSGASAAQTATTNNPIVVPSTRSSVPLAHFVPAPKSSLTTANSGDNADKTTGKGPLWTKDRNNQSLNTDYGEDYSSDSESQFTYTQVGIAPLRKLSAMGPMLNSMSMDSCDSSVDHQDRSGGRLHDAADDSSMLQLDDNIGLISDSPTFHRSGGTGGQHSYPNEEETPVTKNAKCSSARLAYNNNNIHTVPYRDDPSPIRATTLQLPASSINSTLSSDIITMNKVTGFDDDDIDSQPSDECKGDSMTRDLQGFANELDRIKRDIGMNRYSLQSRVPSDEFVENENNSISSPTANIVLTPVDDVASKKSSHVRSGRGRR